MVGQSPAPAQEPPVDDSSETEEEPDSYEEDLGDKLLRKTVTGVEEDVMAQILRLMHESARKLSLDFDPGAQTQGMQVTIVERLDEAIKVAAAQQQRTRGAGQAAGDKRHLPEEGETGKGREAEGEDGEGAAATDGSGSTAAGVVTETPERRGGPLSERRRAWGNLPPREREEVIQGSSEGFLERYRQQIERYYRALQEADE